MGCATRNELILRPFAVGANRGAGNPATAGLQNKHSDTGAA